MINPERGTPRSVYIGVPAYGIIEPGFVHSLMVTCCALQAAGVKFEVDMNSGHSLIAKARNEIVDRFLASGMEALFFIDADIGWEFEDFWHILHQPELVLGGTYRLKQQEVKFTCQRVNPLNEVDDKIECERIGTGFLRIKREVFEKMQAPLSLNMRFYFNCRIIDGQYWGEDYAFCRDWREQGGSVWMYPCKLVHYGRYGYTGAQ